MYLIKKKDKIWTIVENDTEHSILYITSEKKALELCSLLNKGYGFDGNTPRFFANHK